MNKIEFFFDFLSPYSYLALLDLSKYEQVYKSDIEYIPISLAQLLDKQNNPGPMRLEFKRNEYIRNICFKFKQRGLDIKGPLKHPFMTTLLHRFIHCLDNKYRYDTIISLFQYIWLAGNHIENEHDLSKFLTQYKNIEQIDNIREYIKVHKGREKLINANKESFEKKIFGVPSFVYNNIIFWGSDNMSLLNDYIKDPKKYQNTYFQDMISRIEQIN